MVVGRLFDISEIGVPFKIPSLIIPSGVAPVTASIPACLFTGHDVICTGNEIKRKTRPTSAGLKMLFPKPPNDNFPNPMAAIAPTIIIHHGKLDGTLKASKIPVTSAEPSVTDGVTFKRYF